MNTAAVDRMRAAFSVEPGSPVFHSVPATKHTKDTVLCHMAIFYILLFYLAVV